METEKFPLSVYETEDICTGRLLPVASPGNGCRKAASDAGVFAIRE